MNILNSDISPLCSFLDKGMIYFPVLMRDVFNFLDVKRNQTCHLHVSLSGVLPHLFYITCLFALR